MQQITCPQCAQPVEISPDAPFCPNCQADLRDRLSPAQVSRYFYQRAVSYADAGQVDKALAEVNRGLAFADGSELRLLGAILAKRNGDFVQMRGHVAAIPVDDVLRGEGEWLVRSHQARQRNQRVAGKADPVGDASADDGLPFPLQTSADDDLVLPVTKRGRAWPLLLGLAILVLLAFVWLSGLFSRGDDPATADAPTLTVAVEQAPPTDGSTAADTAAADTAAADTAAVTTQEPVPADEAPAQAEGDSAGATDAVATPTVAASPTPAPTATPEDIDFDLTDYLMARGYSGLALLDVTGELEDGVVTLTGKIPMAEDRDALLDVIRQNPNITTINTDGLDLTPPATYTVQAGDSLWSISFRIYGDTKYMDDIFRLNRDDLPSPEVLVLGMQLKLPPLDVE